MRTSAIEECGVIPVYEGYNVAHNNENWDLYFVKSGKVEISLKNGIFVLSAGDMLLRREGTALLGVEISADGECLDFYAEKDVFESICENYVTGLYFKLLNDDRTAVVKLTPIEFSSLLNLCSLYKNGILNVDALKNNAAQAKSFFLRFLEKYVFLQPVSAKSTCPSVILRFIEDSHKAENYGKTLSEIVNSGEYCIDHFTRLFKKHVGVTPLQYVNSVKLTEAKKLLKGTDLPLREIASELGFESESYFHRLFSKTFGITPKKYRICVF